VITALRITKYTTLAVPNEVVLIPVPNNPDNSTTAEQTIEIESQIIPIGSYARLVKDVVLEPGTHCLALKAQ